MINWTARGTLQLLVVCRRLGIVLLGVAVYWVTVALIIRALDIRLTTWGSAWSLINTLILGLLMSFRNGAAYQRWWEARGLWGKLVNDSRNLAAKCAAFIPDDIRANSRFAQTLTGFADSLRQHLRDEPQRLADFPGFEHDNANPPHVPLYLAQRLFNTVADWKRAGHLDQATLWILDPHLSGLLDVCGGCEKIRHTPLSPSYKALLRTGLVLNVLAEPWLTVPEIGFWGLPVFILVCFFLFGVELIDTIVEEPFGHDGDDLNLDRYCQTIRESVTACLNT
jgi:ion channel-forming bestrophin family protein